MIATCPGCETRYRLAPEKIGAGGARIRCKRCGEVFKVNPPQAAAPAPVEFVATALVAESDPATAKRIASYLASWAIQAQVFDDAGRALLAFHRKRPDLAILGAGLSGLDAPGVAEILRRNPDLQDVPLVRVAVPGERPEAPEFDADHTLEPADLPDGLGAFLDELGVGRSPGASGPAAAPSLPRPSLPRPAEPKPAEPRPAKAPAARPAPSAAPARPPAAEAAAVDPDVKAAERLARIVVSDIILYNEDKFAQAAAAGNVAETLAAELDEASAMFRERVSEELRATRDFLVEELDRRAQKHLDA